MTATYVPTFEPTSPQLEEVVTLARTARQNVLSRHHTIQDIRGDWKSILQMGAVVNALTVQERYRRDAENLAGDITEKVISRFAESGQNVHLDKAWKVAAVCHNPKHAYPVTAALLSIGADELKDPENGLSTVKVRHTHLTHSLHTEDIRGGVVYHTCGHPANLEFVGKINRLLPKEDAESKWEAVINEVMRLPQLRYYRGCSMQNVGDELRIVLRAFGDDGVYASGYDALRDTMHRAITIPHIAANIRLTEQNIPMLYNLLNGALSLGSHSARAEALAQNRFIRSLERIVADNIQVPSVVAVSRVKGASLGTKYVLMDMFEAFEDELKFNQSSVMEYFRSKSIKFPSGFVRPNPHDIVGLTVILHGDAITYDTVKLAAELGNGKIDLPIGEEMAISDLHDLFYWLADIPSDSRGYETARNGSPDFTRPLFNKLGERETRHGFVACLTHDGVRDRTIAGTMTGYKALNVIVKTANGGSLLEVQLRTNLMDNVSEFDPTQSHDIRKAQQHAMLDYLCGIGKVSEAEVFLARRLAVATL